VAELSTSNHLKNKNDDDNNAGFFIDRKGSYILNNESCDYRVRILDILSPLEVNQFYMLALSKPFFLKEYIHQGATCTLYNPCLRMALKNAIPFCAL